MRTRSGPSFIETQRREQIVDAAIAVLAQSGHRGLTFVRIAEEAAISPGLITYHFATKAALVEALGRTLSERLDQAMAEPAAGAATYVDALYAMITGFVRHCAHRQTDLRARYELEQLRPVDPRRRLEDETAELEQMISDGQSAGEFRPGDARTLSHLILALMRVVPSELASDPGVDVQALAHETAASAVHLLADPARVAVRRRLSAIGRARPRREAVAR